MWPIQTQDKLFHDGNGTTELGTIVTAEWLNNVQQSLLMVLAAGNQVPAKSKPNLLRDAIQQIINNRTPAASSSVAGIVQLSNSLTDTATNKALTAAMGKKLADDKLDKSQLKFVRPVVLAGSTAVTLDLTNRQSIIDVFADAYISHGCLQLVLHNVNDNHNISGLPLSVKSAVQLDFCLMGGYTFIDCHYILLGRSFRTRVNFNSQTLNLDWIEQHNSRNSMASTGAQTLDGTLTINNSGWGRLYMPTSDGGNWRLEVNPAGDADKRFNFVFTRPNNGGSVYIHYPAITKTESVAYQSYVDNKNNLKTVDYATDQSSGHVESGFYRNNNHQINGHALPNLDIHINHPTFAGLAYARGIGFSYGGTWGVYTTSYNKDGQYLGTKKILTEDDAVPAGTVCYMAGAAAPAGWLKANGAAVSRTTYSALFAAIGTRYGAGNGTSTFNLPDLRGEFVRGWDDGRGIDANRELGSQQADALQQHTHTIATRAQNNGGNAVARGEGGSWGAPSTQQAQDARTADETRPRNIALMAIIKI